MHQQQKNHAAHMVIWPVLDSPAHRSSFSVLVIVTTLVATIFSFRETLTIRSVLSIRWSSSSSLESAWYLMMPDSPEALDSSFGLNGWLTVVSALMVAGAGFPDGQGGGTTTSPHHLK